jgi:hypothetical protein
MYRSTHRLKIQSAIAGATLFFCGIVSGHFIVPVIVHPVQAVQTKINQMDVVLQWNDIALNLIRTDKTSPPMAARNLAMLHTSIYDAVNGINPKHKVYKVNVKVSKNASGKAAAIAAAYRVLTIAYPKQASSLEASYRQALALVPESLAKSEGVKVGIFVADQIITWRSKDGSNAQPLYVPLQKIGSWQPIPPDLKPASMPYWKDVQPFVMKQRSQFRISKMPSLGSAEYTQEFNLVKKIGAAESNARTTDQTAIAQFWLNGPGTLTPPGHWNQMATHLAQHKGYTLAQNARLLMLLNVALADASIIDGDQKYTFHRWRPLTAIRQADADSNPQTSPDFNWVSLLPTPASPAYVSGHSTFSGAADAVLTQTFGQVKLMVKPDPSVNLSPRSFSRITQAAEEAGMSRIYGGAHWPSDNRDGLAAGRALGTYVMQRL